MIHFIKLTVINTPSLDQQLHLVKQVHGAHLSAAQSVRAIPSRRQLLLSRHFHHANPNRIARLTVHLGAAAALRRGVDGGETGVRGLDALSRGFKGEWQGGDDCEEWGVGEGSVPEHSTR